MPETGFNKCAACARVVAARRFQHTFGRTTQTKILDAVWNHRRTGINIRHASRLARQSYVYTTLAVKELERHGMLVKRRDGVDMILFPNPAHPVMKWAATLKP